MDVTPPKLVLKEDAEEVVSDVQLVRRDRTEQERAVHIGK